MSKFFADIDRFHFADENLCMQRYAHACQFCDPVRRLTDDTRIQRAVDDNRLSDLFQFIVFQEITASVGKFLLYCVIDIRKDCHALFGCADHTVIKGLGMDDGVDCHTNICGAVDDNRRIACANAQSRLAAGVSRLDHARTACGKDGVGAFHQLVCQLQ